MKKALIWGAGVAALLAGGGYGLWRAGAAGLESALDAQIAALAAQGVTVSHGARALSGFPFGYVLRLDDVRAGAADGAWRAAVAWTRSEAGLFGGAAARTTFAPEATLAITPPQDAGLGAAPLSFTVTSQDLAVETPLVGSGRATVTAKALSLVHPDNSALGAAEVSAQELSMTLERFATGAAKVEGAISRLTTALDITQSADGRTESVADDVVFSAQGRGWRGMDLPAFLRGDGEAEVWVSMGALTTTGPEGAQGGSGPTSSRLRVGAGRLFYTGETAEARYALSLPQTGAQAPGVSGAQLSVTAARTAIALEAPLAPAAAAQAYLLDLTLDGVAAPEALWAAFDPEALLPRDPVTLKARVSGAARVLVDLAAAAETPGAPVAVETVEITGFSFTGFGAIASGDAALKIIPGAAAPDGRVFVTVEGWRPVLDAAVRLGVATPDLAIFLTSIAEALNSPDANDGVFTSQIELRGGAVFANGTRVN